MRRKTVFDVMPKRSHIQAAIRGYTTEEDVRHALLRVEELRQGLLAALRSQCRHFHDVTE